MATIGTGKYLESNRFFNGQRLFAADLQSVEEFNREMRWLHNRSLHQPGIGSGMAVAGKKGDREVVVQPGYAIDAQGREIVLAETDIEPVPPVASDGFGGPVFFDLTISYPDEKALTASETRDGVCGAPRSAIRLRETPVFCWVRLGPAPDRLPIDKNLSQDVQTGMRLRLARAQVLNCQLDQPISLAQRRNARPAEQPYVACGKAGTLAWTLPGDPKALGVGLELRTTVDTSAAGFRTVPCYVARLAGGRSFTFNLGAQKLVRLLDGFVTLQASAKGFDFSLLIPESLIAAPGADPRDDHDFEKHLKEQIATNGWAIEWMGTEG